jgi:hypothetical protein
MNKCLNFSIGEFAGHIQLSDGDPWSLDGAVCPSRSSLGCCYDAAVFVVSHNEFRHSDLASG